MSTCGRLNKVHGRGASSFGKIKNDEKGKQRNKRRETHRSGIKGGQDGTQLGSLEVLDQFTLFSIFCALPPLASGEILQGHLDFFVRDR